jgi:CRP/FNR family cyclic AMP-dependent transcriptional regulator
LNGIRSPHDHDLDKLSRLKALSWLSSSELNLLSVALTPANFSRSQVIFGDGGFECQAHILLRGIARITCRNVRGERITIALLPPGLIPEFPTLPSLSRFDFECAAYNDCRVGSVNWKDLNRITLHSSESAFRKFHENDMAQWYRLLLRSSGCLNLGLHERLAITLRELASDFGIKEARGTLLRVSFSHQDIADLVGASRPRVTEHLAQMEREQLVTRQGRHLIVRMNELENTIAVTAAIESSLPANSLRRQDLIIAAKTPANGSPQASRSNSASIRQQAAHGRASFESIAKKPINRLLRPSSGKMIN